MIGTLRGVVAAALVLALATASQGCSARVVADGPLVGVLDNMGKVLIVDLETGDVVRSIRLRSRAFDIAADAGTGTFVTAQSGGIADDADDRIGVIDVRGGRGIEYVKLPRANPLGVEVLGPGRVLVDHGALDEDGVFACVVDTRKGLITKTGSVPDATLPLTIIGGSAWSCGHDFATARPSVRRVDLTTLDSVEVLSTQDTAMVLTGEGDSLFGWLSSEAGRGSVTRFDGQTCSVEASSPVDLAGGCGAMATAAGKVVAADWSGDDLDQTGTSVLIIDPDSLKVERSVRVSGGACDLKAWRDRVIVASYRDNSLLILDPKSGAIEREIDLPGMSQLPFQIAVME